jgi:hypothetical protein
MLSYEFYLIIIPTWRRIKVDRDRTLLWSGKWGMGEVESYEENHAPPPITRDDQLKSQDLSDTT